MATRRFTEHGKCIYCRQSLVYCVCEFITPLTGNTLISYIIHFKEIYLPSNTAHFFSMMYKQTEFHVRGKKETRELSSEIISPKHHPLYLFPSADAVELTPEFISSIDKPIQLIIPDGRWKQVHNVWRREKVLLPITRVKLPPGPPSIYKLRKTPKENAVSTFEATARALGMIESQQLQTQLEVAFEKITQKIYSHKPY